MAFVAGLFAGRVTVPPAGPSSPLCRGQRNRRCGAVPARVRMTVRQDAPVSSAASVDFATTARQQTQLNFHDFFSYMPGTWNSERTYHYLGDRKDVERSQSSFDVERLKDGAKLKVLRDNNRSMEEHALRQTEGFQVSFKTRMEKQGFVMSYTNLLFVPESEANGKLRGLYYRDLGYEERVPIVGEFVFLSEDMSLRMITKYTRVVSVDSIKLINDNLRVRQIINYMRPKSDNTDLTEVVLAGFGTETKSTGKRLVG